jgi:hypothetical protein
MAKKCKKIDHNQLEDLNLQRHTPAERLYWND